VSNVRGFCFEFFVHFFGRIATLAFASHSEQDNEAASSGVCDRKTRGFSCLQKLKSEEHLAVYLFFGLSWRISCGKTGGNVS